MVASGGGQEDSVNDLDAFIDSLEKAFGRTVDFDGNDLKGSIFKLAARYENTAKKMRAALDASPYRPNILPKSPDIFHLRLGASNFFVPPLTIDVNTSFRSGSLTGGAIRQKSSPKFNTGYKETSIRIKLFFPNYEEIWGIKIDDASKISLNDNYQIDFSTKGSNEEKIDKFLSSLRGLVAAFKYSPFLPVRNHYLNTVYGITAVALSSMSISTIPNFPFALAVDIELLNFNHKPFLPMINDFNQAVHWGKYRQFMGKAAGSLHNYVNGSFLMKTSNDKANPGTKSTSNSLIKDGITADRYEREASSIETKVFSVSAYENDKFVTNVVSEWTDGRNISFYVPAESQTKIFLPDATSFRTEEEKMQQDYSKDFWGKLLGNFGIDVNESAGYGMKLESVYDLSRQFSVSTNIYYHVKNAINILTGGVTEKDLRRKIYQQIVNPFVIENKLGLQQRQYILNYDQKTVPADGLIKRRYTYNGAQLSASEITLSTAKAILQKKASSIKGYLDEEAIKIADQKAKKANIKKGTKAYDNLLKEIIEDFKKSTNIVLYETFFKSASIEQLMEAARARQGAFQFREWEVPMIEIDMDPKSVIVTGVSLTLGNNLAKLQFQMQDEPTYQHIGGRDTFMNISMRVFGESELNKLKRVFDHVNALARLEHSTSVIGFIGIKNIITALAGVKYVIPSSFSVSTIPNFPHVYDVNISLLDFDIFQQGREKLSSAYQKQMIEEFGTKRNPFLRLKQMWGIFNAYPDLPLEVKDKNNEIVGHLDPDFYFRSFEMFDRDVINSFSNIPKQLEVPGRNQGTAKQSLELLKNAAAPKILDLIRNYENNTRMDDASVRSGLGREQIKKFEKELIDNVIEYLEINNISYDSFMEIFKEIVRNPNLFSSNAADNATYRFLVKNKNLITQSIEYKESIKVDDQTVNYANKIMGNPYQVGDYSTDRDSIIAQVEQALSGKYSLKDEDDVSFHLDDLDFVANLSTMPIIDNAEPTKVPAILSIGSQIHLGYLDTEKDGRFYLTVDGTNVKKTSKGAVLTGSKINDNFSDPAKVNTNNSVYGLTPMSEYGSPYSGSMESQWESVLVDTQYRDVSGRMLRAFPTYMLWLIDEGGHFAGVKVFDNFYGLQSIIDFSIVTSEDLLGDTLVLRVSNMYSKLSKKESTSIFNPNLDKDGEEISQDSFGLSEGLSRIIDRTLNKARYVMAHMKNDYVVDIENIRLKPGVRVHLRGGYGSNPNSLQTLFNGTITQVEQGEIVTITAQSDAIELGAVVNSTNKKGDSGKIDGGINTGFWLSEPRDLMVRLLSMGSSRFREGVAHANRGVVFSENKFGIRHFGNILYEPLSVAEEKKHYARLDAIADAYNAVGNFDFTNPALRPNGLSLMQQLSANFAGQRDLEIFKRNIYPGNGTGIAQFLGGDLGDGWTTVASLTPEEQPNERLEYLSRLTDRSWNELVSKAGQSGSPDAKSAIDSLVSGNKLIGSDANPLRSGATILGVGGLLAAPFAPAVGLSIAAGAGLTGVLSGRGSNNLFRMMGLVSANDDDDMPGFDEVSFRAQTYMRSVWDLFKVCARLLPNYIVAVRPFEDRSTIFYGKPHWLYTSGVVPITTGHPTDEKMAELGLSSGPKAIKPDEILSGIMAKVSKESSPYADQNAFLRSTEPIDQLLELSSIQKDAQQYYAASGYMNKKILNFDSIRSQTVTEFDPKTKKTTTKAKLPQKKGYTTVGFHLPVQGAMHRQITQLPQRFQYPFFSYKGFNGDYLLQKFSYQYNEIDFKLGFIDQATTEVESIKGGALGFAKGFGLFNVITGAIGAIRGAAKGASEERVLRHSDYVQAVNQVYGSDFIQLWYGDIEFFETKGFSPSQAAQPLENAFAFNRPPEINRHGRNWSTSTNALSSIN